ncbi:pentapeptide repeat-containing protein [Lujinxingia vulgaris]|uniref:Pentapeptide repeat-containing protein n=1 Tax=Lujinxingia vulgaris TaxID=2600176 RepID=A0A5C6XS49_9DELT|nr:pentapeptide repeat-containing protein [Lujinxingia vulgaris]TXD42677.1 pentapeptide repeat-containing protein [Lujinxingia vulgaris]
MSDLPAPDAYLNTTINAADFTHQRPFEQEVYACEFVDCEFLGADLRQVAFVDCTFRGCNLAMVKLAGARLQGVQFVDCKLMGVSFFEVSDFGFSVGFEGSNLNYASMRALNLRQTSFTRCTLQESDLYEADLRRATFEQSDVAGVSWERANLEGADLRGAINLVLDPAKSRTRGMKVRLEQLPGLVSRFGLKIEG